MATLKGNTFFDNFSGTPTVHSFCTMLLFTVGNVHLESHTDISTFLWINTELLIFL